MNIEDFIIESFPTYTVISVTDLGEGYRAVFDTDIEYLYQSIIYITKDKFNDWKISKRNKIINELI